MAQKQFINYQADIKSFEAREAMLGVLNSGRYSGYLVLAANGAPSAGNIPLKLQHTGGIQKLANGASVLSDPIGVMLTTQGVLIHEDLEATFTITDNNGGGSIKHCLVYMEHEYDGVTPGSNPATYGVINGTAGGGIPTLTSAYKRSVVGVVEIEAGGTSISECLWHPKPSEDLFGDSTILQDLWGSEAEFKEIIMGTVPSDGIIGTRLYTEDNFVVDEESITNSIDALDQQLKDTDDEQTAIGNRAIDDTNWGALSDTTDQDVSTSTHGLMPKLPDDADKFLNGVGAWTNMPNFLLSANNLNDVQNAGTARGNLGVLSGADIEAAYFEDSGWQDMIKGPAAAVTGFNVKARRIGKLYLIQGTFADGATIADGTTICYIQYLTLGISVLIDTNKPTEKIHFQCGTQIGSTEVNRGMLGYVEEPGPTEAYLNVKVDSSASLGADGSTVFSINLSFFGG